VQNRFKIDGFVGPASDEKQPAKMATSGFLSPARLPFRYLGEHSGETLAETPVVASG
jgi:hypothetical protein